jgi:hypothetical protein
VAQPQQGQQLVAIAQAAADAAAKAEAEAKASKEAVEKSETSVRAQLDIFEKKAQEAKAKAEASAQAVAEAKKRVEAETKVAIDVATEATAKARASADATARVAADAEASAQATAQASAEANARAKARAQAVARAFAEAKEEAEAIDVAFRTASAYADAAARMEVKASDTRDKVLRLVQVAEAESGRFCKSVETKIQCTTVTVEACGNAKAIANSVVTAAAFASANAKATAEAAAFAQAQAGAIAVAVARAQAEATAAAKAKAQAEAAAEAIAKARAQADAAARAMAKATGEASAEARAKATAAANAKAKAEAAAKAAAEAMAKAVADAKAAADAAAKAVTEIEAKVKVIAEAIAEAKAKAEAEAKAAADANAKAQAALEATKKAVQEGKLDDAQAQAKAAVDASAEAWAHAHATADVWVKTDARIAIDLQFVTTQSAEASASAHAAANALAQADAKVRAEVQAAVEASAEAFANAEASAKAQARAHAEAEAGARAGARASALADAEASAQAEAVARAQASATASADAKARAVAWADASAFASARATASAEAVAKAFADAQTSVQVIQKLDTTITEFTDPKCQEKQCEVSTKTLSVNAIGPKGSATAPVIGPITVQITVRRSGAPDLTKETAFSLTLAAGTRLTLIAPLTTTVDGKQLKFKEWQEGASTSSSITRDATLDQDRTLTAVYEEIQQQVPELAVNPTLLEFRGQVGSPGIPAQSFRVTNTGQGILNWSARNSASWLRVVTRSGTLAAGASQDITVQVDIAGLSAGVRQDEIIVEAPGARNSPQRVRVTLELTPPQPTCNEQLSWYFGEFEGGTPPSFTAIRSFPSDVMAAVQRCNIQTAVQRSGQLPPGVSFTLDFSGRTGRLSGPLPNTSVRYVLIYELFAPPRAADAAQPQPGQLVGTLTVTIDVRPTQRQVTLDIGAICIGCATGPIGINGVPINVNGVPGNTPFTRQVPQGSSVTVSAPSQITAGGQPLSFQRWERDGSTVSTSTSYSFTATANTSLRVIYAPAGPDCCTLQFRAFVRDGPRQAEINVPIAVNGVTRTTPFTVTLPFNAPITIQAPSTITHAGSPWRFQQWESDGRFLSSANPLSGRTDKNETIAAIYVPAATVTLNIRAVNTGIEGGAPMNVPIRVTTPSGTTDRTTPFSVTVNQGSSVTLRILQDDFGSCGTAGRLRFDRWSGLVSSTSLQVTFTANSSGTITAEYRCK